MNQNDFKTLLKEAIEPVNKQLDKIIDRLTGVEKQLNDPHSGLGAVNKRLNGIEERLDDSNSGLAAINSRLDANTAAVIQLEETVNGYGDMYKINEDHIKLKN